MTCAGVNLHTELQIELHYITYFWYVYVKYWVTCWCFQNCVLSFLSPPKTSKNPIKILKVYGLHHIFTWAFHSSEEHRQMWLATMPWWLPMNDAVIGKKPWISSYPCRCQSWMVVQRANGEATFPWGGYHLPPLLWWFLLELYTSEKNGTNNSDWHKYISIQSDDLITGWCHITSNW